MKDVQLNPRMGLVFDHIRTHLLTQNAKAVVHRNTLNQEGETISIPMCRYRTPEGLRCAIGSVIADDHYDENLETRTIQDPSVREAVSVSLGFELNYLDCSLLNSLQCVHDNNPPKDWDDRLAEVRKEYFSDDSD